MKMRFLFLVLIGYFVDANLKCYQCTEDDVYGDGVDCFDGTMDYGRQNRAQNTACTSCSVERWAKFFINGTEHWQITRGCSNNKPRSYDVRIGKFILCPLTRQSKLDWFAVWMFNADKIISVIFWRAKHITTLKMNHQNSGLTDR